MKKIFIISLATFTFSLFTQSCKAQYTELYSFVGFAPSGLNPYGSVIYNSGLLYGMTFGGGANGYGTVFSIDTNGNNYNDLWDFDDTGSNGRNPYGSLIISGNTLYGMTRNGGRNGYGNIFSIHTDGTVYIDLCDFSTNANSGGLPEGSLTLSGSVLYGMTQQGGANGKGNIFSIFTNGTNYADLLDFDGTNGAYPVGDLIISGSIMYGMAPVGGAHNDGLIFTITNGGNGFTDLFDFNGVNGSYPNGDLTLSNGKFYGMTYNGGVNLYGIVFSVSQNGTGFKDLLDFSGTTTGASPLGNLTLSGSTLYGMTNAGGTNGGGTIFSIDSTGNSLRGLYDFNAVTGENPYYGSLAISGSVLYGMTFGGGAVSGGNYDGIVFGYKDIALGVDNINVPKELLNVYPNPSSGLFNLQVKSGEPKPKSLEVYNVLGEKVYSSQLSTLTSQFTIDLSNQPAGVYLYILANNVEIIGEGKLIIQK